jgi:hypothetical protein
MSCIHPFAYPPFIGKESAADLWCAGSSNTYTGNLERAQIVPVLNHASVLTGVMRIGVCQNRDISVSLFRELISSTAIIPAIDIIPCDTIFILGSIHKEQTLTLTNAQSEKSIMNVHYFSNLNCSI